MYLKRLEIQGFKSFAKKTVLEFEPGVTSIVGPNGSGKSNVADSVRWVLGEQSTKLIRGKKSDDVIFAGSDKKTKLGFAETIATFDNSDGKIPVDTAEVSIGRRVDRSGESEYLINGNKVRLLDIVDLVLKSNIGTSRYTVIGQGTIDQMILSGPAEIKNLLDEASGVKSYYIKRDKTLRRLEQTAQNLMRAEDVINEIEPRLRSLRRQAKRQESRLELETELKVYQREWFSNQYHILSKEIIYRNEKISGFLASREQIESSIKSHLQRLENYEKQNKSNGEAFTLLRDQLQALQGQKNRLFENLSLIRGKMQSIKVTGSDDTKSLTVEAHSINRKIEEVKLEIISRQDEEKKLAMSSAGLNSQMSALEETLVHVYEALSNPESLNLEVLTKDLENIDYELTNFLGAFTENATVSDIQIAAESFKQVFINFKERVIKAITKPGAGGNIQEQLHELLKQKEFLSRELGALGSAISRAVISREFLQKQLEDLQQEALRADLELKKNTVTNPDEFLEQMMSKESLVQKELQDVTFKINEVEDKVAKLHEEEAGKKELLVNDERAVRALQDELGKLRDQESNVQMEKVRFDTQLESLAREAILAIGEEDFTLIKREQVKTVTPNLEDKIQKIKHQLELIGGVDELTIQEYRETEQRFGSLTGQTSDLRNAITDLRKIIDELDEHIRTQFNESFNRINEKFEFYFRLLFNGGRGALSILRSQDEEAEEIVETNVVEETGEVALRPEEKLLQKYEQGPNTIIGIDIKAVPPGKKLSSIQALSGGERALTSIALLCAMLACFPSPFVVLDEVDAALDDANTIRFGQILSTLSHQTQFVTITHNRETMAQSNTLYGVTMGDDGVSKVLSVKFDQATSYAK